MSGPITAVVAANPVAALLSAAAIRAAAAVYEGYVNESNLRQAHNEDQRARQAHQTDADEQGREALEQETLAAQTTLDQLIVLADNLGLGEQARATRPQAPAVNDVQAQAAHVRALQTLADDLRAILLTEAARRADESSAPLGEMHISATASVPQSIAQRLLARIAHLGPPPADLQDVALELDNCLPGERADLLATELRKRIQTLAEETQRRQVQEASAVIVGQSLKDLGYQVEEIAETLFVEGGIVHFRRQGWGNYMVRMRIDPKTSTANFNVIRAVAEGENERSVLDHLAEDRWCAEFPALMKALEARGISLNVTRRLAAGELPVQLVDAGKLPTFADEEAHLPNTQPLTRTIK